MKTIRAAAAAFLALSAILILSTHQASGQDPYTGPIFGDLPITGNASPGSTILLSGDGFAPDLEVSVRITESATAEVAHEGQTVAGTDGSVSVEILIDASYLGNYTAALKGQTIDGSTLELAGAFVVPSHPEPIPEPTPVTVGDAPTCFGSPVTIQAVPGQVTVGTSGPDVIMGTSGPDDIRAKGGNDKVCSKGGNDIVRGGSGSDKINLGSGHDIGKGGKGADLIRGKKGRDRLFGNGGRDTLVGGSHADRLWGGSKADILKGKGGDDTLRGGKGIDACSGGKGVDQLFSCNELP